jgi:hypothetical protein
VGLALYPFDGEEEEEDEAVAPVDFVGDRLMAKVANHCCDVGKESFRIGFFDESLDSSTIS